MATGQENAASLCRHLVKRLNVDKGWKGVSDLPEKAANLVPALLLMLLLVQAVLSSAARCAIVI